MREIWKNRPNKSNGTEIDSEGFKLRPVVYNVKSKPSNVVASTPDPKLKHPKWNGTEWVEGKPEPEIMEDLKEKKIQELDKACEETILSGFSYQIDGAEYHFSFDIEAQMNFQGAYTVLNQGLVHEIMWTAKKDGEYVRVPVTKQVINELMMVILQHKNMNISRYRDELIPKVKNATAIEAVKKIEW